MDVRSNEICTFCNEYPETYRHLFLDCRKCKENWKAVLRWIEQNSGIIIHYQPTDILLGWIVLPAINCILIIIIKQYIYSWRVAGKDPNSIMIALTKITSVQNIEKITENKDKIKIHNDKWTFLLNYNLLITCYMFIKYLSYSSLWCMHWGENAVV